MKLLQTLLFFFVIFAAAGRPRKGGSKRQISSDLLSNKYTRMIAAKDVAPTFSEITSPIATMPKSMTVRCGKRPIMEKTKLHLSHSIEVMVSSPTIRRQRLYNSETALSDASYEFSRDELIIVNQNKQHENRKMSDRLESLRIEYEYLFQKLPYEFGLFVLIVLFIAMAACMSCCLVLPYFCWLEHRILSNYETSVCFKDYKNNKLDKAENKTLDYNKKGRPSSPAPR